MSQNNPTPNSQTNPPLNSQNVTISPTGQVILPIPNQYYTIAHPMPFTFSVQENKDEETKKKASSGCSCRKCKEFNEYAEANQEDGSFICYGCRRGF